MLLQNNSNTDWSYRSGGMQVRNEKEELPKGVVDPCADDTPPEDEQERREYDERKRREREESEKRQEEQTRQIAI